MVLNVSRLAAGNNSTSALQPLHHHPRYLVGCIPNFLCLSLSFTHTHTHTHKHTHTHTRYLVCPELLLTHELEHTAELIRCVQPTHPHKHTYTNTHTCATCDEHTLRSFYAVYSLYIQNLSITTTFLLLYIYIQTYVYVHTHTHTHAHTHTHTHTHTHILYICGSCGGWTTA